MEIAYTSETQQTTQQSRYLQKIGQITSQLVLQFAVLLIATPKGILSTVNVKSARCGINLLIYYIIQLIYILHSHITVLSKLKFNNFCVLRFFLSCIFSHGIIWISAASAFQNGLNSRLKWVKFHMLKLVNKCQFKSI